MRYGQALILSVFGLLLSTFTALADLVDRTSVYGWEATVGYTQIVEAGDFVFLSGVISDQDNFNEQVTEIYTQIIEQLEGQGLGMDAVVRETIFTTDMAMLQAASELRKTFYPENLYPSSSWIEIERLYFSNNMLEVAVTAYRGKP